ncbi:5-oxoprolinase subunit PxpA [uncultured Lutibacter sp.]|uniref:5-oxoprolinase subunit PxpA n=1 Tax=uncultured Lutibacter sp. TaxID=437739 RepID=UPI0026058138|nr:5-oxoprolinase subunit PxpA [uncultured Lutibacter sp.]
MKKLDVNCDVGEGINNEQHLMPFIQSCNIACGGHAGNAQTIKTVVNLAIKYGVKIGAHPSYPDKDNFGRITLKMDSLEFINSIRGQIKLVESIVLEKGGMLNHIKPHGALYNDIAKNNELSKLFLDAIFEYKKNVKLYVPYNSVISNIAEKMGFSVIFEAFGDRSYNNDLSLVSRNKEYAVLNSPKDVINQISNIFLNNFVKTISGKKVFIKADTFCIHSDTENANKIINEIAINFNK